MSRMTVVNIDDNPMIAISPIEFLQDTVYLIQLIKEALAMRKVYTGKQVYVELFVAMRTVTNFCATPSTYELAIVGLNNLLSEITTLDHEADDIEFIETVTKRVIRNLQFLMENFK